MRHDTTTPTWASVVFDTVLANAQLVVTGVSVGVFEAVGEAEGEGE